jgi:hypothetical protein
LDKSWSWCSACRHLSTRCLRCVLNVGRGRWLCLVIRDIAAPCKGSWMPLVYVVVVVVVVVMAVVVPTAVIVVDVIVMMPVMTVV